MFERLEFGGVDLGEFPFFSCGKEDWLILEVEVERWSVGQFIGDSEGVCFGVRI